MQSEPYKPPFKIYALLVLISFVFWILLTGNLQTDELITGVLVAIVVSLVSSPHVKILEGLKLTPTSLVSIPLFLLYFARALVLANFDMARRVLSPKLPIDPAVVKVKTQLQSDLGRLLLANSITLTPGTLSIDVEDDYLLIHWVDCPDTEDQVAITEQITEGFEKHLRGFVK